MLDDEFNLVYGVLSSTESWSVGLDDFNGSGFALALVSLDSFGRAEGMDEEEEEDQKGKEK